MFQEFPYTNFHELNLDWIVKIAKDFLDQYTHIQEVIQTGLEDLAESRETGLADLAESRATGLAELNQKTLDGLADLQEKYDTLNGLLQAWYDTHSADIAGQLAAAIADFNTAAETKSQELLDSWPDDYSTLVTEYNNISNSLIIPLQKMTGIKKIGTVPATQLAAMNNIKKLWIIGDETQFEDIRFSAVLNAGSYLTSIFLCDENDNTIRTTYNSTTGLNYVSRNGAQLYILYDWDNHSSAANINVTYANSHIGIETDYVNYDTVVELVKGLITNVESLKTLTDSFEKELYELNGYNETYKNILVPEKKNLFDKNTALQNKAINDETGAVYTANNYYATDFIEVKPNYYYIANENHHNGAYYDQNKAFVSGLTSGRFNAIIPNGCYYVRFTLIPETKDVFSFSYGVFNPTTVKDILFGEIDKPIQLIQKNLFDKSRIFDGVALNSSGKYVKQANYATTETLEVEAETEYKFNATINLFAQYNANMELLSLDTISARTVTTNANCKYIRITIPSTAISTFMFCKTANYPNSYMDGIKQVKKEYVEDYPSTIALVKQWQNKVLCTIGDSLTNTQTWQDTVLKMCGFASYTMAGAIGATIAKVQENSILQAVQDMDTSQTYDFITFWGGTNDWGNHTPMGDFDEEIVKQNPSETNFYGACICCLRFLLDNFPSARIMVITPTPRSGYINNSGENTVKVYGDALKKVALYYGLPVLDLMEFSGINEYTFDQYMYLQGTAPNQYYLHFTSDGGKKIGRMIGNFINNT